MGEHPRACAQCIRVSTLSMMPVCLELLQPLVDLGEHRAGCRRRDGVCGSAPAQLLRDLVAERLAAVRIEGADVDVHECPLVLVGQFTAEAVDVVVAAVDRDHGGVVDGRAQHLARFEVVGDEDVGIHPGPRRVGGHCAGEVAGGGAGERLESELQRLGGGDGNDAVLERVRRVDAVVLDPQLLEAEALREAAGADERSEARVDVYERVVLGWEKVRVAPRGCADRT